MISSHSRIARVENSLENLKIVSNVFVDFFSLFIHVMHTKWSPFEQSIVCYKYEI